MVVCILQRKKDRLKLGCHCKVFNGVFFSLSALIQMTLPISVEDVRREVKILRTLSGHENVVQFYAAFEDDDMVYIVME
jgi:serine/threonine protein kinase